MELLSYITSKIKLDPEVCSKIVAAFKTESYTRGAHLIKPGGSSSKVYFIEKGLIRTFYYKDERDITQFFFDAGSFTTPLNSVFYGKEEPYGWETLEDTIVKVIPYHELEAMCVRIPEVQRILFLAAIDTLNMFVIKLESLQFQTAEQRYSSMMEMYPEILLRVPLGHIASYLGITQQTLSVIRAKR
jgi:CRP-like cAMP-binding protein